MEPPAVTHTPPVVYLVAVDGSASSQRVVEVACSLGSALGGAAELHLVHVLALAPPATAAAIGALVPPHALHEAGRAVLDAACAHAGPRFAGRIAGHLPIGDAAQEIAQMASHLRADLLVVGTEGKTGLKRMVLGSVAEKVVRHAGCPVLVARAKDYHAPVVPSIEPPCADCMRTQDESARAKLWCARHSEHHAHGRLHYETPPSFAKGTMLLRPE